MNPKLPKSQRRVLRFAYELMRGDHVTYLPYVHGLILRRSGNKLVLLPGYWIEPDKDPDRLYLNEANFSHLTMQGYLECQQFLPGPIWLYRLTREGCAAMDWTWLLNRLQNHNGHRTPQQRHQQEQHFQQRMRRQNHWGRNPLYHHHNRYLQRHPIYHRLFK